MKLEDLGFNKRIEAYHKENFASFDVGRVISEHRERYHIVSENGEFVAELIGNLVYSASNLYDFPAVGDWVAFSKYDEEKALIYGTFPRTTIIERRAAGSERKKQIIATNVDHAWILHAVDMELSLNRLERYVCACHTANVDATIALSKTDLVFESELRVLIAKIKERIPTVPIISIDNATINGYSEIHQLIRKGETYCLLGSSGVGKSTLINGLMDDDKMKTDGLNGFQKGKHTTTHRMIHVLTTGGVIIDNPGMREFGMTEDDFGLEQTFEVISELAAQCKFNDCTHSNESDCAITTALRTGALDQEFYQSYLKLQKEKAHFESNSLDRKRKDKDLGKKIRLNMKSRKQNKF